MLPAAKNLARRKRRYSRHDAAASFRIPRSANARRSRADSGRREGQCDAARGRHGPAAEHDMAANPRFRNGLTALAQAASLVATPQIRNMATLGGNICLDTRCNYYDQSYE